MSVLELLKGYFFWNQEPGTISIQMTKDQWELLKIQERENIIKAFNAGKNDDWFSYRHGEAYYNKNYTE